MNETSLPERDSYSFQFDITKLPSFYQFFMKALDISEKSEEQQIMNTELNNPRQRTINIDCVRTRSHIFDVNLRNQQEKVLTYFCHTHGVTYKQGMNEIAAPFIFLAKGGANIGECYKMFQKFFSKFCLNFYDDDNFNSIELFVKMFSVVLKYHDPSLFRYLEWHNVQPQIFCISWLMTLFACKLSFQLVFELWSFMMIDNDQYFLFFIVLAIVLSNRENILEEKNVNILVIITNLIFKDTFELKAVLERALLLRQVTPSSLILLFRDRAVFEKRTKQEEYTHINQLVENITNLNLFLILPSEMALQDHLAQGICENDCYFCDLRKPIFTESSPSPFLSEIIATANQIRSMGYTREFVLVDLRADKSTKINYQAVLFEVDLSQSVEEVVEAFISQFFQDKYRKHFVFILSQFQFQNLESCDNDEFTLCKDMLVALNSMSFPLLGILEGGFEALEAQAFEKKSKNSQILTNKKETPQITYLPFNWKLTIRDRWKLSNCLLNENIAYEEGIVELLIITQNFILVCEKEKEIASFLNYFQHNSSPLQYLYEKMHAPSNIFIRRIIPIFSLKKAAMKIHYQNTLVISYEICSHFQNNLQLQVMEFFQMRVDRFLKLVENCQDCQGARRKVIINMMKNQLVKQAAKALEKRYIRILKIIEEQEAKERQKIRQTKSIPKQNSISNSEQ